MHRYFFKNGGSNTIIRVEGSRVCVTIAMQRGDAKVKACVHAVIIMSFSSLILPQRAKRPLLEVPSESNLFLLFDQS